VHENTSTLASHPLAKATVALEAHFGH